MKRCFGPVSVLMLGAWLAHADDQAVIDITGLRLEHGLNQSRSSAPDRIDPAFGYQYVIAGQARGTSGLLAILYPSPVDLADILEGFEPGASEQLTGEYYNVDGTHPLTIINQRFEGSTVLLGRTVTFGVTLSAFITASDFAGFSMTDVVMLPSSGLFRLGTLQITSGSVILDRIPARTGDMNWDGRVDFDDIDAFVQGLADPVGYLARFGYNPVYPGDCNRDGVFNFDDIDAFVLAVIGG